MKNNLKARVFISCGQQKNTDEVEIAKKIAEKLDKEMDFECYIAVEEQSLKGVTENIFRKLSESEYFIFIDFKREKLFEPNGKTFNDTTKYRGSLFSHQELAIAAFLDIKLLAFQEIDVKNDDGILGFIQANCFKFTDRQLLPAMVSEQIKKQKWNPNWRNELLLERNEDKDFGDVEYVKGRYNPARFYHIKIKNLHEKKIARDCFAYLEKIKNLSTNKEESLELVEFKWKGVKTSRVGIPPEKDRKLDAFHIYYNSPSIVHLGINPFIVDFSGYNELYTLKGPNTFELTYIVFSENFSPARATFILEVGDCIDNVKFYKKKV